MLSYSDIIDAALERAQEAIATGETRGATDRGIRRLYPVLSDADRTTVLDDALTECLAYGIEREDIDGSWFRS